MPDSQHLTFDRATAGPVERIGRRLVADVLGHGDSLLTPGTAIWNQKNLRDLHTNFVDNPDAGAGRFFEKLTVQLEPSSDDAIQLFAELFIMNVLPIINLRGSLKVEHVQRILSFAHSPVEIPQDVHDALAQGGVYHGGVAFGSYRWDQIGYLIRFAEAFIARTREEKDAALKDPLTFRGLAYSVETGQAAQRQSLLYLGFPAFYLPIVNPKHRRRIRDVLAPEYLGREPGDIDQDLYDINEAVMAEAGGPVDYYLPPWRERWDPSATPNPTDAITHAWKIHGSSVAGHDMLAFWQEKSIVSLAARFLRPVDSDVGRDVLKGYVEEDYRTSGYAERRQKFDEFYDFLARINEGDLIVTVSRGRAYFATVTGDAEYTESDDDRSNLRRPVAWEPHSLPIESLPQQVRALLNTQGEVVDLTQQIATLQELVQQRTPDAADDGELHLRDADDELAERLNVPRRWLQECIELLRDRPQLIFYGPPGTGKTYIARDLARFLADDANVSIVQFHPAYSYEDFFEGFRPVRHATGDVGFDLKPGPLRRLVDKANDNPDAVYVLIIDEINRGNIAKIFGELYFLLEYRSEGIKLMYGSEGDTFMLPKNIILLGTMNTADRSIALVDSAMRRRFHFTELHPGEPPVDGVLRRWLEKNDLPPLRADLLDELNSRIAEPDFQIGHSYLMTPMAATNEGLERIWRHDILPLLEELHYGDPAVDVRGLYGLDAVRAAVAKRQQAESADASGASSAEQDTNGSAEPPEETTGTGVEPESGHEAR